MILTSLFNEMRLRSHQPRRTAAGSVDDKVAVEPETVSVSLLGSGQSREAKEQDSVPLRSSDTLDVAGILYGLAEKSLLASELQSAQNAIRAARQWSKSKSLDTRVYEAEMAKLSYTQAVIRVGSIGIYRYTDVKQWMLMGSEAAAIAHMDTSKLEKAVVDAAFTRAIYYVRINCLTFAEEDAKFCAIMAKKTGIDMIALYSQIVTLACESALSYRNRGYEILAEPNLKFALKIAEQAGLQTTQIRELMNKAVR